MLKDKLISTAEVIDAWRVVPRLILLAYGYLVIKMYSWFITLETYVETKCDASLMTFISKSNPELSLTELRDLACTVVGVVGGPTTAQSAFVTTIIGLSTAVIGLYVSTGRKWGVDPKSNVGNGQPMFVGYPTVQQAPVTSPINPMPRNESPYPHPKRDMEVDEVKFEE